MPGHYKPIMPCEYKHFVPCNYKLIMPYEHKHIVRTATAEEYWPDIEGLDHRDTVTDFGLPSCIC